MIANDNYYTLYSTIATAIYARLHWSAMAKWRKKLSAEMERKISTHTHTHKYVHKFHANKNDDNQPYKHIEPVARSLTHEINQWIK